MRKWIVLACLTLFFANDVFSQKTYEELIEKGMEFAEKKDYSAASALLESAMKSEPAHPSNVLIMVNLAAIKRELNELEESLLLYNTAINKYPENNFIRHNRAALLCEMLEFDKALQDYNAIILHDEKNHEAYYRRGLINLENKDVLAAEEDFEKVLNLVPEHLNAKKKMAFVQKLRQNWKEAEEIYTDLIYKYREDASLYYQRADCYLHLNKLARTQEDLTKANKLGYNSADINTLQGKLFLAQYDKRMAEASFLKAKEEGANEELINELLKLCK